MHKTIAQKQQNATIYINGTPISYAEKDKKLMDKHNLTFNKIISMLSGKTKASILLGTFEQDELLWSKTLVMSTFNGTLQLLVCDAPDND